MPTRLRQSFESQITDLQEDTLRLGSFVVQMLELSVRALVTQDADMAARVCLMDDAADSLDLQIEQTCIRLLALQQPMARDLRTISTALKVITDLERIGDFAVDIAKTARRLSPETLEVDLHDLSRMSEVVQWMVRACVQAFVEHDLDLVSRVVARDDEADMFYDRIFSHLLDVMESNPALIRQATWLTHVARFLERVGDHAVNVAERVYYMETGQFRQLSLRHGPDIDANGR